MTYSTGTGSYTDLMAAVLAHAIADGWTTTGGDWPISKGAVRGVDWTTTTFSRTDFTGGLSTSITERRLYLAIGTSGADATANAAIVDNSAVSYNLQYAITAWHIFSDPAVSASGVLTFAANATDGDTVTIGSTTYILETTLTDSADNVHIGGTASDTIDNLIAAITAGAGAGTDYGTGTVANAEATASAGAGDTMDVTALRAGWYGNSVVTSTTGSGDLTFADTSLAGGVGSDYIHVVFQFTNGFGNSDCFTHFGFGEIDTHGLSHSGGAWASGSASEGFAGSITTLEAWNSLRNYHPTFGGSIGKGDAGSSEFQFMMDDAAPPVPVTGGWPQPDILNAKGSALLHMSRFSYTSPNPNQQSVTRSLNSWAWAGKNQPFSGAVTLGVMPLILLNGSGSSSLAMWLGVIPNVRMCRLDNYNPGDEITLGSDTWGVFPLVRSTENSQLETSRLVTSGRAGYAYKKVEAEE